MVGRRLYYSEQCLHYLRLFCQHVWDRAELYASADAEDDLPYIVRGEAGDLRNWLWERLWTGDYIFLRARTPCEKRPQTAFAWLEVKEQLARQSVRLTLYIGFHARSLKVRVAVVI